MKNEYGREVVGGCLPRPSVKHNVPQSYANAKEGDALVRVVCKRIEGENENSGLYEMNRPPANRPSRPVFCIVQTNACCNNVVLSSAAPQSEGENAQRTARHRQSQARDDAATAFRETQNVLFEPA